MKLRVNLLGLVSVLLWLLVVAEAAGSQGATATPFPSPLNAALVDGASTDGSTILASLCGQGGSCPLYVAGGDGSNPHPLGSSARPVGISAAGDTVAWTQADHIYVAGSNGSAPTSVPGSYATLTQDGALLVLKGGVQGRAAQGILRLQQGASKLLPLQLKGASTGRMRFTVASVGAPSIQISRSVMSDSSSESDSSGVLVGSHTWGICATVPFNGSAFSSELKRGPVALGLIDTTTSTIRFLRPKRAYEANPGACVANAAGTVVVLEAGTRAPTGDSFLKAYLVVDYHGRLRQVRLRNNPKRNTYELAALSPNGRYALLAGYGNPAHPVEIVDLSTGRVRAYGSLRFVEEGSVFVSWSPDSTRCAFQLEHGAGSIGVVTARKRTHALRMIHAHSQFSIAGFTPDGRHLLVEASGKLEALQIAGGQRLTLTHTVAGNLHIRYSPDLSRVWISEEQGSTWYVPGAGFGTSAVGIP